MDPYDRAHSAANDLAVELHDRKWYHRTSVVWEGGVIYLTVWGEYVHGKRPPDCPSEWVGYRVRFNRVTPRSECPFGSVKARTRTRREQDE